MYPGVTSSQPAGCKKDRQLHCRAPQLSIRAHARPARTRRAADPPPDPLELSMAPSAEQPAATPTGRGRVRLRRAALMAIPACVTAGVLVTLTAQNVLATQFAISGMAFEVTADRLDGTGFEQFGTLDNMIENSPNAGDTGGQLFLIQTVVKQASLTKLCQSVNLGGI